MAFNAKEGRRKREGEGSAQRILDIVARLPPSIPPSSADILRLSLQRLPRLGTVAGAGGRLSLALPHSLPSSLLPPAECRQTGTGKGASEEQERRKIYRVTTLNVTRIWITLAVWAAMVSTAKFSLSGSRLLSSPGR